MSEYFRKYIKKEHYPTPPSSIKYKTNFKNCVSKAFIYREWKETYQDDWNVMWCDKEVIDWVFQRHRVLPNMRVNHFRGWSELCRKDMLNKNLKKFKRGLEKQNNKQESNQYDFLPSTYLLPSEYVIFYEEFKRMQNDRTLWIMKPTSKCQGRGIFIFNKITQISKWKSTSRDNPPQPYVCQRYLLNPLLFGGRKFDMRIYALCTSYQPLTIYLYRAGFARFAHDRYDNNDLQNLYKHLTNVAININAPNYVKRIGGKWFLQQLKIFMLSKLGIESTNRSFSDVQRCIIKSMKAVQKLVTNCPQSFQLYGFDFIFDSNGKAWLLEVNGGPSMTANTTEDQQLKIGLIDDTMTIVNIEGILKGDEEVIGGFDLIHKGKDINSANTSLYSSMLGARNNRQDNLKKLARTTAYRLAKEFQEKNKTKQASTKRVQNKFNIKTNNTRATNQKTIGGRPSMAGKSNTGRNNIDSNDQGVNKKVISFTSINTQKNNSGNSQRTRKISQEQESQGKYQTKSKADQVEPQRDDGEE